jgi:hypothetical protein
MQGRIPLQVVDDGAASMYVSEGKIYPREVSGRFDRLRKVAVAWLLGMFYLVALAALGRPPGGAVRPAGAQVPRLRADLLAAGFPVPGAAADHGGARAVLLHRAGRAPVVRLRLPADGVDRGVPVDGALDRGRPQQADEARRKAPWTRDKLLRKGQAPAVAGFALWTGFTFVGFFTPITDLARAWCPSSGAVGDVLGAVLRPSRPGATPASCASRCASTCARTRASRARCSTATP